MRFWTVDAPPEKHGSKQEDEERLGEWYIHVDGSKAGSVAEAANHLAEEHEARISELDGMPDRTLNSVWWPFTQHGLVSWFNT